jgi:hypothetical protein
MPAAIDITGQRFGRLVALALHSKGQRNPQRHPLWLCVCDCGQQTIVIVGSLRTGNTRSCGCLQRDVSRQLAKTLIRVTHGQSRNRRQTAVLQCWNNMMQRCFNSKCKDFKRYGGRGIKVCERWRSFTNFFADMGPMPDGYSIERIDVNGDYEPVNCKWIPLGEQWKNKRSTALRSS